MISKQGNFLTTSEEIGSEFDLNIESTFRQPARRLNNIFRNTTGKIVLTESGRAALRAALCCSRGRSSNRDRFLVPAYLCEATLQPFVELGLKNHFYPINEALQIDWESVAAELDSGKYSGLLFIRYFGSSVHTCPPPHFFERWPGLIVIEDLAQAFLTPDVGNIGDYVVYSMRKWLGLPDGGAVVVRNDCAVPTTMESVPGDFLSERLLAFHGKQAFRNGFLNSKRPYLERFKRAEEILGRNRLGIAPMSTLSAHILKTSDLKRNAAVRRENFRYLYHHLPATKHFRALPLTWGKDDVPLGFPIVSPRRDWLRGELRDRGIFCPIHWQLPRTVGEDGHDGALALSRQILTLPCDQRYTAHDMSRMITTLEMIVARRPN